MLKTIHLHGYFSAFHNGPVKVVANTAAEAVKMVTAQLPGFRPSLMIGKHKLAVVGFERIEDLFRPLNEDETEIHLIPQFNGGKKGGFLQILIGAVAIAAAFWTGGASMAAWGAMSSALFATGIGMVLGGLVQLMSPQPEVDTYAQEQVKSRYLGTPKNTVKIGTRIPIVYGRRKVYGHYLSFDIDAKEVA